MHAPPTSQQATPIQSPSPPSCQSQEPRPLPQAPPTPHSRSRPSPNTSGARGSWLRARVSGCLASLGGSPRPGALETGEGGASCRGTGVAGEKLGGSLSGAARGMPGNPEPWAPPAGLPTISAPASSPSLCFSSGVLKPVPARLHRGSGPLKSNFATSSGNPAVASLPGGRDLYVTHFRSGATTGR